MRAIEDAGGVKILRIPRAQLVNHRQEPFTGTRYPCGRRLHLRFSSIYPIHHDLYGLPGAQRFPYTHTCANGASLREYPPATARFFSQEKSAGRRRRLFANFPPLAYTRWFFRLFERSYEERVILFICTPRRNLILRQPRIRERLRSRLRHYTNLSGMKSRLEFLLRNYTFQPFLDLIRKSRTL